MVAGIKVDKANYSRASSVEATWDVTGVGKTTSCGQVLDNDAIWLTPVYAPHGNNPNNPHGPYDYANAQRQDEEGWRQQEWKHYPHLS